MSRRGQPVADEDNQSAIIEMTADIVSAYVGQNRLAPDELPLLIATVHSALNGLGSTPAAMPEEVLKPAVSIRKSITPDYLISLEDGRKYKSLKRHLRSAYNLTPEEYRAKWGLPKDYPMVAPNYAASRSELAKSMGLGRAGPIGAQGKAAVKPVGRKARSTTTGG